MTARGDRQRKDDASPPPGGLKRLPIVGPIVASPAFRNADFRRLWAGAAFNHFGMSGEQLVLGLLVYRITGSSAWVGAVLALYTLPMLIFGVLSGVIADGFDRRLLLRRLEIAIAANLALFSVLLAQGLGGLPLIMVLTVVSGSIRAIYQPARTSYAYDVVGGVHIVAGLGLLNLGTRLGQFAGALVVGVVMERFGAPAALLVLALAHVVAFGFMSRLRSTGQAAPTGRVPIRQNLREYFHEISHNQVLLTLVLVTAAVEVFGFSFATALPELATTRFGLGADGLGAMHAARAAGGIVAGLALAGMGGVRRQGVAFIAVIYAFGGSLVLLAVSGPFVLVLAALVAVAALATASDVLTQSMVQLSVPNHLRGRAMGSWVLAIGSAPLGHLEMGALVATLGVSSALAINGVALVGVAVIATVAVPRLRRL